MKVLAGLGNPGSKYENTRHNAGFIAIDVLADPSLGFKHQHKALTQKIKIGGEQVILVKPQTYMNLSGESLSAVLHYYKVKSEDLLVFVDVVNL